MAVRGVTRDVALTPVSHKNADPAEVMIPAQIDLRNGYLTDMGSWRKRPGMKLKYDLGVNEAVELLIPEGPNGYAVTEKGKVFALGRNIAQLSGNVSGTKRATWINHDGSIIITKGSALMQIRGTSLVAVSGAPTGVTHMGVVDGYLTTGGQDDTQWQWSDVANHNSWTATNITETETDGQDIQAHFVSREHLYFFKDHKIEIWDSVGGVIFFARTQVVPKGTLAPYSVVNANGTFYWLGDDRKLYLLNGATPQVISQTMNEELFELPVTTDCYGLDFRAENAIRWFFPTHGRCFRFDYRLGAFSEDNSWQNAQFERLPVNSYMEVDSTSPPLVGDYRPTGKIFTWTTDNDDDDGEPIRVYRKYALPLVPTGNKARINRLQFRVKRGSTREGFPKPMFTLRYRLDRGEYKATRNYDLGAKGERDPYINVPNIGVAREIEMEIYESDATEFLLTNVNMTVRDLGR